MGRGGGCRRAGWPGQAGGRWAAWEALGAERSVCWAEAEGIPPAEAPCPANDMVLCLLHGCLGQELSDREAPLPATTTRRLSCESPGGPATVQGALPLSSYQTLQRRFPSGCWPPLSCTSELCSLRPTSTFIVGPEGPPRWGTLGS